MKVEADADVADADADADADAEKKIDGGGGSRLSANVSELERRLRVEKDSYDQLKSESELAMAAAIQEIERHARDCSSLRESVARLEVDCGILRERESRDRERIRGLLEEFRRKDREFSEKFVELKVEIRDLESGKMRALDEARGWKKKCEEKGVQENFIDLEEDSEIYGWKIKCEELERNVARLEEEGRALRERELSDQERMKGLLQAAEAKGREILELERARKRAQDEVSIWMEKYAEAEACRSWLVEENLCLKEKEKAAAENAEGKELREMEARILKHLEENFDLVDKRKGAENAKGKEQSSENNRRMEGSSYEPAFEIYDEVPKITEVFMQKSSQEDLKYTPELNLVIIDSDYEGEQSASDSDAEEDRVPLSQLSKKRCVEGLEGAKRDPGSVSLQPCGCTGAKEASAKVVDVQIPSGTSSNTQEVGDLGLRDYGEKSYDIRNLENQPSLRRYTGLVASSEQLPCMVKRAKTLQRNLKSCNPSFVKVVVPSNVSTGFWFGLPKDFSKKNFPAQVLELILEDEKGLEYKVKYHGHKTGIGGGWSRFAMDHNLEVGNALVFELIDPTRFKVYIIKAIPEEPCRDFDDRIAGVYDDVTAKHNPTRAKKRRRKISVAQNKPSKAGRESKQEG